MLQHEEVPEVEARKGKGSSSRGKGSSGETSGEGGQKEKGNSSEGDKRRRMLQQQEQNLQLKGKKQLQLGMVQLRVLAQRSSSMEAVNKEQEVISHSKGKRQAQSRLNSKGMSRWQMP
jgi:hypothetical protein